MEPKLKNGKRAVFLSEDEDPEDPRGPMMHWEGDRSEEDRQFMSNWVIARKAELEREQAQSASKTD